MTHVKLITALETAFEVRFAVKDVIKAKSIGDLKGLLSAQGVEL